MLGRGRVPGVLSAAPGGSRCTKVRVAGESFGLDSGSVRSGGPFNSPGPLLSPW
ncbi:hypothetical protein [Brachybacterium sacelli]|uniref:hypothetical protein n=1 Tax=Brachybacterium sacelli TaxID=173364 RepID=UPI003616F554